MFHFQLTLLDKASKHFYHKYRERKNMNYIWILQREIWNCNPRLTWSIPSS